MTAVMPTSTAKGKAAAITEPECDEKNRGQSVPASRRTPPISARLSAPNSQSAPVILPKANQRQRGAGIREGSCHEGRMKGRGQRVRAEVVSGQGGSGCWTGGSRLRVWRQVEMASGWVGIGSQKGRKWLQSGRKLRLDGGGSGL